MTTTEEIVVCGEDFIERRIYVSPEPEDLRKEFDDCGHSAYQYGYGRGWIRGFFIGVCVMGAVALAFWWAVQW